MLFIVKSKFFALKLIPLCLLALSLVGIMFPNSDCKDKDGADILSQKRMSKCSGCKLPANDHKFGPVGPYCEGPDLSKQVDVRKKSLLSHMKTVPEHLVMDEDVEKSNVDVVDGDDDVEQEIIELQDRLQNLQIRENSIRKRSIIENLRKQIQMKERELAELEEQSQSSRPDDIPAAMLTRNEAASMTSKGLRRRFPKSSVQTPLDAILGDEKENGVDEWHSHIPPPTSLESVTHAKSATRQEAIASDRVHPQFLNAPDPSEMFLNPASQSSGKKAYLIPDFVCSKVVQDEDSNVVHLGHNAKLSITYGQRKPKLTEISLSQWNAANIRIMHKLIETKQLPTYEDVKSYLAYTVKINQLVGKYKWHSILVYDGEFHIAQAKYLFPWSYDSHHMHSVHLIPMLKSDQQLHPVSSSNSKVDTVALATKDSNGLTICRNFNCFSGCNLRSCNFSHCCNRR